MQETVKFQICYFFLFFYLQILHKKKLKFYNFTVTKKSYENFTLAFPRCSRIILIEIVLKKKICICMKEWSIMKYDDVMLFFCHNTNVVILKLQI